MIQFKVTGKTFLTPEEIVNGMFDVSNWTSFKGKDLVRELKKLIFLHRINQLSERYSK